MAVVVKDGVLTAEQCDAVRALHRASAQRSSARVPGAPPSNRTRVDSRLPPDVLAALQAAFAEHVEVVHPVGHIYESRPGLDVSVAPHRDSAEQHNGRMSTHTLLVYATTTGTGGRTRLVVGPPVPVVAVEPVAGRVVLFPHTVVHSGDTLAPTDGPKVVVVIRARARARS
jgi:hypothetical protein